jgi:signal peptidase I
MINNQDGKIETRKKQGVQPKIKTGLRETIEGLLVALVAALILRQFVIQAFRIPTGSMEDTLLVGDFLLVNKFMYGAKTPDVIGIPLTQIDFFTIPAIRLPKIKEPKQGDIVVFKYPKDPTLDYIKRCVAVSGQTLEIKGKVLYVDGKRFPDAPDGKYLYPAYPKGNEEYGIFPPGQGFNRDNYGPIVIPEGYLFMMGDNRDNSADSRYWGYLSKKNIVGEASIIYWSWDANIPILDIFDKIASIRWGRIGKLIK